MSLVWGLVVWYIRTVSVMKSIIRAKKSAEMRNLSPLSSCIRPSWRGGRRGRFSFHLLTLSPSLMTYGYIRVSSDKQTVENQRFEINAFVSRHALHIDGWIEETISGTKAYDKRALGALLRRVAPGDTIICSELSRLGRNLFMIMEILNLCMTKECRVWTIKDNYRLGDDIQSKVLAFAFGLSAEIERNLISQRTREALARRRAEGVVLGRPKGRRTAPEKHKLYPKRRLIAALLAEGVPKRQIARICRCDRNTLARFVAEGRATDD